MVYKHGICQLVVRKSIDIVVWFDNIYKIERSVVNFVGFGVKGLVWINRIKSLKS